MKTLMLLLSLFSIHAYAKEPLKGCLSEYDTQNVNRYIKIRVGQDWNTCDANNRYYQLVEAFTLMQNLEWGGKVAPAPYNQEILGYDWFYLFTSYVNNIAWGEAQSPQTCKSAMAYANLGTRQIATCLLLYSTSENVYYQGYTNVVTNIETLMHEARHLMGYKHVSCNGVSQGCDKSIGQKGSYAATVEAYAKMGLTASNLHPAQSSFARRMAYVEAISRFVKKAVETIPEGKRLPVLRTKDGQYIGSDGTQIHKFMSGLKPGKMIHWLGGMFETYLLINSDSSEPELIDSYKWHPRPAFHDFNEEVEPIAPWEGDLSFPTLQRLNTDPSFTFKDSILIEGRITETHLGWIIGNKIVIERARIPRQERRFEYLGSVELELPNGELPVRFRNGAIAHKTDTGYIYVLSDKDHLFKIAPEYDYSSRPTKFLGFKITEEPNPYPGFIDAYYLDEETYLIDKAGRAYVKPDYGSMMLVPGLENHEFSSIEFHWYSDFGVPPELQP